MRLVRSLSVLLARQAGAFAQAPWLDAREPSPFVPDGAPPRRAVLALARVQYAEVRLDPYGGVALAAED